MCPLLNRYGATPLSEAVRIGSGALIGKLLDAGADANTTVTAQGETVLMTRLAFRQLEAVKVLLDHGADVNAKENFRGQTALMWAAAEGHADVIQALAAQGRRSECAFLRSRHNPAEDGSGYTARPHRPRRSDGAVVCGA